MISSAYIPFLSIMLYITSMFAPEDVRSITIEGEGFTNEFERTSPSHWTAETHGLKLSYRTEQGIFVEEKNEMLRSMKISDYLSLPVRLNGEPIEILGTSTSIRYERGENSLIFYSNDDKISSSGVTISWGE